jgi:hypothetical protein
MDIRESMNRGILKMVQKQKSINNQHLKPSSLGNKKGLQTRKSNSIDLLKSLRPDKKQFDNYRSFFRYLLSDDIDHELVDGV